MDFSIKEVTTICVMVSICMVRMAATLAIAPFFSRQFVVGPCRNVVTFALCMPLFYFILPTIPKGEIQILYMGIIIIKEAVIGIILGFVTSFVFYVAEGVGFVVDVQRGASMATIFDPMAGSQTSLMGSFLIQVMSVLFFTMGGITFFLKMMYSTYQLWPVFSYFPQFDDNFVKFFADMIGQMMTVLFCLAAPILIVIFLSEFGLGLVNRFAPQLNVFFLSMPIKSWISMFFLMAYLGLLSNFFIKYFTEESKLSEFINLFMKR